jgi:hypothetical protein
LIFEELGIDGAQFCASFKTSQGNMYACYHFDKELTEVLIFPAFANVTAFASAGIFFGE